MPEGFANVEVLNDWKGQQTDASVWSPREALLQMLAEIDSGRCKPKAIVIMVSQETIDPAAVSSIFRVASPDLFITLGLMEHVKARMLHGDED